MSYYLYLGPRWKLRLRCDLRSRNEIYSCLLTLHLSSKILLIFCTISSATFCSASKSWCLKLLHRAGPCWPGALSPILELNAVLSYTSLNTARLLDFVSVRSHATTQSMSYVAGFCFVHGNLELDLCFTTGSNSIFWPDIPKNKKFKCSVCN